jgi:hypothetical protein
MQLYMRAIGLHPDDIQKERELTSYLLKQRDEIRNIRRAYVSALADNDPEQAQSVQEQFQRAYPELGPLQIKSSDLKAEDNRRNLTRIQRLMKTMPADYREYFGQVVAAALANDATGMFSQAPEPHVGSVRNFALGQLGGVKPLNAIQGTTALPGGSLNGMNNFDLSGNGNGFRL